MRGIRRVATGAPDSARPEDLHHAVKQAIVRHHRIHVFRGGPTKHSAYLHRGQAMAHFEFIQINPGDYLNFLVVDVDKDDAVVRLLHPAVPEPHWIIENPANGHAQAGWMIEPVLLGQGARPHPIRYAQEVQRALDLLTGNDAAFTRFLVRNPAAHSPAGDVRFGRRVQPYSLGELRLHMQDYRDPFDEEFSAWPSSPALGAPQRPIEADTASGRNNAIFYRTRSELWGRYQDGKLPALEESLAYASSLNDALTTPLPHREIRDLAASAIRQVAKGKGRLRNGAANTWFAAKGRKGGQSTTRSKREAAAENAHKGTQARTSQADTGAAKAGALRSLGRTLAEIAKEIGKSIRTIQRYLSRGHKQDDITQASGSNPQPSSDSRSSLQPTWNHSPALPAAASRRPQLRTYLSMLPVLPPGTQMNVFPALLYLAQTPPSWLAWPRPPVFHSPCPVMARVATGDVKGSICGHSGNGSICVH